MRIFYLDREQDRSGISGLGRVAEGVIFTNGKVALTWLQSTDPTIKPSIGIYDTIEDVEKIHCYTGAKITYDDTE